MKARSLRLENERLKNELCRAQSSLEVHALETQDAKAELDREVQHSDALKGYVERLQQQISELEERQQKDAAEAACSTGLEETATGAPSSDRSAKTLESATDSISEGVAQLFCESSLVNLRDMPQRRAAENTGESLGIRTTTGRHEDSNEESPLETEVQDDSYLEDLWDFVVQGPPVKDKEGPDDVQKKMACFPRNALDRLDSRGIACLCARGHRLDATVPNQDDFLLAVRSVVQQGHVALYGVFDGHGPTGHRCSAFVRSFLPECIFSDAELFSKPKSVLRRAFAKTQQALLEQPFNVQVSGTTATLVLIIDGRACGGSIRAYVAHIGDSRAVLVSRTEEHSESFVLTTLTREHRPDEPEEEMRIKMHGGEVRKLNNGAGAGRVFVPGTNHPALPLTRSLGVSAAAECGVLPEPEIASHRLRPDIDVLLVLGTDGLFEFCSSRDVAAPLLEHGTTMATLEEICALSKQRWAANSYNQTVDDMTVIAVSLGTHLG